MSDDCPDSPLLHSGCEYAEVGAALGRGVKRAAAVPLNFYSMRASMVIFIQLTRSIGRRTAGRMK